MGARADRKEKADKKREGIVIEIVDGLKKAFPGTRTDASMKELNLEFALVVTKLERKYPKETHIVKQAAFEFMREWKKAVIVPVGEKNAAKAG